MKSKNFTVVKYDADEGYVFDWKEPRYIEKLDENNRVIQLQEHLYVNTVYISGHDSIDNYIEVPAPKGE